MGVGAGLYMYDVVVKKFTFTISSPSEFLFLCECASWPVTYKLVPDFNHIGSSFGKL